MNNENHMTAAPVHRLVGQLRELLDKAPAGEWGPQHNNYGTGVQIRQPDGFVNVFWWHCEHIDDRTEDCRDLVVAAINALPALLAIAESAAVVSSQRNGPYLMADMDATQKAESDLRTALSLPPNAEPSGPPSDVVRATDVAGSAAADC
jgi:hypothetical protein